MDLSKRETEVDLTVERTESQTDGPNGIPTASPSGVMTEAPPEILTESPPEILTESPTEILPELSIPENEVDITAGRAELQADGPTEILTEGPIEILAEGSTEMLAELSKRETEVDITVGRAESQAPGPTEIPTEGSTEILTEGPTEILAELSKRETEVDITVGRAASQTPGPTEIPTEGATEILTEGPTEILTEGPTEILAELSKRETEVDITLGRTESQVDGPIKILTDDPTEVRKEIEINKENVIKQQEIEKSEVAMSSKLEIEDEKTEKRTTPQDKDERLTTLSKLKTAAIQNRKYASIAIAVLLFVGGISTLTLVIVLQDRGTAAFVKYKRNACAKKNPSIVDINICAGAFCTFDPSICEQMCPFDYMADDSGCPASCECAEKGIYQGDIRFDESEVYGMAKMYGYIDDERDFEILSGAITTNARLWTFNSVDGRYKIAYNMSDEVKKHERVLDSFKTAVESISNRTCVDFVARTTEKEYVEIVDDGKGCTSSLGRITRHQPKVSLAKKCSEPQVILHTLTHLVGLGHEHVRPDRDAFIEILAENIKRDYLAHFKRLKKYELESFNVAYDRDSVMHYDSSSYVKLPHLSSFVIRSPGKKLKRKRDMKYSHKDAVEINLAYQCMKGYFPDAGWTNWDNWTPCDRTCGSSGERHRYRKCQDSSGRYAAGCSGDSHGTQRCEAGVECPFEDHWLPWGPYGKCVGPCGRGTKTARRKCTSEGKCGTWDKEVVECDSCRGVAVRMARTSTVPWPTWGQWSTCSASCNGWRGRVMTCEGCPQWGGENSPCNTDCGASDEGWDSWSGCSARCHGKRKRKKADCTGESCDEQEENCNPGPCNVETLTPYQGYFETKETELTGLLCEVVFLHAGDFDGDGKNEMLCWEPREGKLTFYHLDQSGKLEKRSVATSLFSCPIGHRRVADFNGDGLLDLFCGNMFTGFPSTVRINTGKWDFAEDVDAGLFCNSYKDFPVLYDLDNDKKFDRVCRFGDGRFEVMKTKSS